MAVGRISGPLLKANLIRNGIDLAFETDLLYLDVNNQRIGIKNASPQYELDVNGTTRTDNLITTTQADIGNIKVTGNTISTTQPYLNLGTLDTVVYQNKAVIDSLELEGNVIRSNDSNANIELRPNGTGIVDIYSDVNVDGNIHATGNISADGNITIGDADTDNITINAEVASNIIPDADNTYTLGSDPTTGGKQWADIYVNNFTAGSIASNQLVVDGIDLTLRQGNTVYVAENGNDNNSGTHQSDPVASITKALTLASAGDTVFVYPGNYVETFPITIPVGVTLKGYGIRTVNISPTTETRYNDAVLVNGESTVEDLTIKDFFSGGNYFNITETTDSDTIKLNVGTAPFAHTYVSGGTVDFSDSTAPVNVTNATYDHSTGILTLDLDAPHDSYVGHSVFVKDLVFSCNGGNRTFPDNGYAFRFATDFTVTSRSPYIRNVTVITAGSTTTAEDPRGFNAGDAGKGPYVDGAYATASSKEASMLFHSCTFICPGVDALTATNGARIEWLNSFSYFANKGVNAFDSNDGLYGDGKTRIRLSGITGTFAATETVTFTSTDASTVAAVTVESVENSDTLVIDGKDTNFIDFDTTPQSIVSSGGATATTIEFVDYKDFGAEIRMIASASVYGNYGLYGDGPGVIVYAIGQNLAYIGNGKEVTNDPGTVIQEREITELNNAKIRYNTVDHKGDFRVGDLFYVNQEDGTVSFVADALNIDLSAGATFTTGSSTTFINGERIDTGNLRITGNTISSTSGDVNFDSDSNVINLQDDVNISGNLDVTGNVTIGGNITIGDEASDSINIVGGINSNLVPNLDSVYSLGTSTNYWNNLHINRLRVDELDINTNYISSTASNADLELRANGTGEVLLSDNDLQIDNNITVDGTTNLATTNITGTVTHNGNYTQTGNSNITGNVNVTGDLDVTQAAQFEEIKIDDNYITTTTSNANLELRANGTGSIIIPDNDVFITNGLTLYGDLSVGALSSTDKISAARFDTGDILIDGNVITTTLSNSDLELRANGTGNVVIDDFTINGNTITSTGNTILDPDSEIVEIQSTGALKLPVGTTAERPTPASGQIRFNDDLDIFEGYDGSNWIQLNGVIDQDRDTTITAELTPGANDNTIRFQVGGSVVADLNSTRFNTNRVSVDDIDIDGNVISTTTANTDLNLSANGTGSVVFENFAFNGSSITNTVNDSITTFENTNNGYVKFDGTYGMVIPVGTDAQRPPLLNTETGQMRFNTTASRVEIWDGSNWVSVAGSQSGISRAEAENLVLEIVLSLG